MFTKLAKFIAVVGFIIGALRFVVALWIVFLPDEAREAATGRYLGGHATGYYIDQGLYTALFCVALGTLAEISQSLRKRKSD